MIHLSLPDVIIILLYFVAILFVGVRAAKRTTSTEDDFLLAGRSLTLPVFVMTLVSTWYGGILGVGEFSYRYGISNWAVQGFPYYLFAAIFAFFLAKKVRATNLFSIPDKLELAYDRKTALLGSVLTFILMTPAPYILMLSVFLQMLFGWNLLACLVVTAITAVSYLFVGGFRSDVETDVVEFVLMFLGFAVILPFAFSRFGGFDFLQSRLPPMHLTWHGGNSIQYILVWFFIALWTLVDPAFHQRCYAAKSGSIAQRGILVSIIFWFVFDFMTATAGLYARAALPNLSEPMMAYPMLAELVLPPLAKGLFYVGMLATIMSTLNTLAFVSAQTLGRDIVLRLGIGVGGLGTNKISVNADELTGTSTSWSPLPSATTHNSAISNLQSPIPNLQTAPPILFTKIGLIVSFSLSVALALFIPSVINMWYTIGTVIIPGLLVPLMASYFTPLTISSSYAFAAMSTGWLTSLSWLILGNVGGNDGNYPFGVEPMYPGLAMSVLCWAFGRISFRKVSREA